MTSSILSRFRHQTGRDFITAKRSSGGAPHVARRAILGLAMAALVFGLVPRVQASAPDGFADLAEKLTPAVVNISTTQHVKGGGGQDQGEDGPMPQFPPGSPFEDFFKDFYDKQHRGDGGGQSRKVTSLGSGFIIDASGLIVTNNHVINEAESITVTLADGTKLEATLKGKDAKTDVALLQVKSAKPLPHVSFGDSTKSRVGDWVLAIGNPFGLGGTVTAGIISARNRDINAGPYDDFIQTDASINRGNSGGPMFNMNGEVIGMNTAIYSPSGGSVGIGFAVPSAMISEVIGQLTQYGEIRRGWLGVRIQSVTDEIADGLGLDRARGALVAGVSDSGPAAKAGVEAGDVILSFNGQDVPDQRSQPRMVAETGIDKVVKLVVWRKGKEKQLDVKVGRLDETETAAAEDTPKTGPAVAPAKGVQVLGMRLAPLTTESRRKFEIRDDVKGVLVTEVSPDGPAAEKGVRPGDVIVEVAQAEVGSPEDVASKVKGMQTAKRKSVLLYLVNGGGEARFVTVRID
jgi:serine protease Do